MPRWRGNMSQETFRLSLISSLISRKYISARKQVTIAASTTDDKTDRDDGP